MATAKNGRALSLKTLSDMSVVSAEHKNVSRATDIPTTLGLLGGKYILPAHLFQQCLLSIRGRSKTALLGDDRWSVPTMGNDLKAHV